MLTASNRVEFCRGVSGKCKQNNYYTGCAPGGVGGFAAENRLWVQARCPVRGLPKLIGIPGRRPPRVGCFDALCLTTSDTTQKV